MEITKENFLTELPVVLKAIEESDFMSFDCEFSGIGEGGSMILPFDTPNLVYHKAKENLGTYTVVQFGLCTFRYDAQKKRFLHRSFNFYVFPRLPERLAGSLRKHTASYNHFSCQPDSLEFLASQQFDFNKWIYKGVGFLRKSWLDSLKDEITRKYTWQSRSDRVVQPLIRVPDAQKSKLNSMTQQVEEFLKDENKSSMNFKNLQGYEKRLLVNSLENKYGTSLYCDNQINGNKEFLLTITKCSTEEEHKQHVKAKYEKDLADMDAAAGFCKIISAISNSNKLVIGHNMYMDLLQTIKTFCCELPSSYADFKEILNKWFPYLLDTKVLAAQQGFKKHIGFANSLHDLYKKVEKPPFTPILCEPESDKYSYKFDADNQHEAGYDAFVTGICFVQMSAFMANSTNNRQKRTFINTHTYDIPWDLVKPLFNKVTPGRIVDMPFFDMSLSAEADRCPDRSFIFYLTFPSDVWVNENINELFSPYGAIQIAWIDNCSCFVTLKDRTQSKLVLSNLVNAVHDDDRLWTVKPAEEYFNALENLLSARLKREDHEGITNLPLKKMKLNCS